ncbi:hypothetical protein EDE05_13619 [Neorhizobium sp. R1-B]|jgi:hypothetical protein|uniref:hypothetical protein n=1 Tax=unclassified Neorhizobium TaxID=2629175 RepID=UPI0010EEDD94|nr:MULTISPECIES: hypothetical protein [unclassified Neorhizobium]TCV59692.1 hypothetical protein EDE09_13219 [Neorhizobium sp. S3-V5DH]TDX70173.1 hypothetical protein EDE05_13619 [Neorhizobium sp. R1-B]
MSQRDLHMARLPDPIRWLRRWAEGERSRAASLHNSRKPRMTPEEARRDHWQMLRYLGLHALAGIGIGAAVGTALILLDIGGLGKLLSRAPNPIPPFLLVIVPFASLFGGAAAASAIFTLPYDTKYRDEDDNREGES